MDDIRYDLVPPKGLEEVCKVLTSKLEKYNKNEWKFGLKWSDVLSSLKKHLSEFEQGHDFTESGLLHIAHVAMNALLLCDYYVSYPFGDDRMINKPRKPRIALDIDDTVLDFRNAIQEKFNIKLNDYWDGSYQIKEYLDKLQDDKEFWVNLKPLHKITFEPTAYITSRSIPVEWAKECLEKNGFPCAPVYSVPYNESKVQLLKDLKIDCMIDDKPENYREALEAGVFCYLMDAPHNQFIDAGHRRIYNLNLSF